jgi:RNA polymerase sigma factor (sigma-70 family)
MSDQSPQALAVLTERIRAGEADAEEELVRRFGQMVLIMAQVRTGDREAARDLAQETMLAVVRAVREGRLLDAERLAGYVCGTARNLINNHLRTRSRRAECGAVPEELPVADCEEEIDHSERQLLVRRAVARLRPTDRLVLLLTLVDGLKPAEIAARLGLTPEVVRQRKCRAVARARDALGGVSRR